MSLQSRVERIERKAGREHGPCVLCEKREQTARERGPRFEVEELITIVPFNCPRCGRPEVFNVVYVSGRRLEDGASIQT